ncbi:MAG TPA: 3-hydroxyacyl-ACP dehydratase FabZ [Desulfobacterales bacterium]|nr:MAG: 3-hydroxyacyl-[acyl-carrier-protein] dehydratase FabZ [Deltaproteobacteria bacterium]HHC24102.1 3-hydroxyacyl-ACP dehydratase FabZ [Desulfobacterales bacterium]
MEMKYDIQEIMKFLPHRYPILLIDRVLEVVPEQKIVALKNVTINEPFFQGHFPGTPIMPGVLIIEAMAQAGGVLAISALPLEKQGALMYFMSMDKVKFRKPVVPGDQLILEIRLLRLRSKAMKMSGIAMVDGNKVAEAEFMASLREKIL